MKETATYEKNKEAIINYLTFRKCFCFRKNIVRDLRIAGFSKHGIESTLRIMRKRKEIKMCQRRGGLIN